MQNQHGCYYPDVVAHMFDGLENKIMPMIEVEETRIVGKANDLVADFIEQKKRIHELKKLDPANIGKAVYSPLLMSARHRSGSLQLIWQELHFTPTRGSTERRRKYVHIPKGGNGIYNITRLKQKAGYAEGLVDEFESKAREIRERWQQLMQLKKDVKSAIRRLPSGVEQVLASVQDENLNKPIPRSQIDFDAAPVSASF